MKNKIRKLLIDYLSNKYTKEELKLELNKKNISYKKFNRYIVKIINKNTKTYNYQSIYKPEEKAKLKTNESIDNNFITEIKNENKNRVYEKVDGLYKLPKDDLRKKLLQDPQLNQYFVIQKNDVYNLNDISFRLRRMCIEYGLGIKDEMLGMTIYNGIVYYLKNLLDKCKVNNIVDEERLILHILKNFPLLRFLCTN